MASLESKTFSNIVTFTRASSATYFNSTGIIKSAATNTPRLDYNPVTLALRGILVEEQRTNLFTYSEDFNNAAWTKAASSIIPNATTSPSGAVNADMFIEDTTTTQHLVHQAISSVSSGTTYTLSCFVKQGSGTRKVLLTAFGEWYSVFDPTTGSVVQTGGNVCTAINVGNGWWRFSAAITKTNTTSNFYVGLWSTTNSYAGDGTSSLFIWGAQVEVGAFPTSYIPSSVTFSGRTSDGTYFNSAGTLTTAGSGISRINYNPSNLNADPFLLLEASRTNSIRNNTMVGAAAGTPGTLPTNWNVSTFGFTGVSQQIVGIGTESGINYLDIRFSGTPTASGTCRIYTELWTTIAALTGQTWTNTLYLKLAAGSLTGISAFDDLYQEYTSAGAYVTEAGVSRSSPTTAGLATQRVATSRTLAGGATTAYVRPGLQISLSGVPIDITLRIGMPQLEQGVGATSVIPTSSVAVTRSADTSTSAAATRSADVASINTLNPWYNENEGTIYCEVLDPKGVVIVGTGDTFDNVQYATVGSSGNIAIRSGGSVSAGLSATIGATGKTKFAWAYKINDFAAVASGGAVSTDSAGAVPAGQVRLKLGSSTWDTLGQNNVNGYLQRVTYYPRRLTNAELQALTT